MRSKHELGLTRTPCGAPTHKAAKTLIPHFVASPDFPVRVCPSAGVGLTIFLRPTHRQNSRDCVRFSHVSFVTLTSISR